MDIYFLSVFLNTPLFGILLSLIAFQIGTVLYKKTRLSVLNPLLVASMLVVFFLLCLRIDYDTYNLGGNFISFFLGPATVVIAVPLYKKIRLLRNNAFSIIAGISARCIAGISSILTLSSFLCLDDVISKSLVPKSINSH